MNNFGDFIRNLRVSRNLGLREAAKLIGIQPPYLSRIEAGRDKPPSLDVIHEMAKIYNVNPDSIIDHAKERAAKAYGDEVMNNAALHVLFKAVRQLDENDLIEVIRKVCEETGDDPEKFLVEIQKRKDATSGPQLSRLTKEQDWLFSAEIRPRFLSKKIIAQIAYKILAENGMSGEDYKAPTPIERIAEQQKGIRLRMDLKLENFKNGKPRQLGMSNWSPEGYREIHINNSLDTDNVTDIRRLRFTVAHELFHCEEHLPLMNQSGRRLSALHRTLLELEEKIDNDQSKKSVYVEQWTAASNRPRVLRTDEDWREWQADYFAACILMPEWSVKQEFEKRIGEKNICVEDTFIRTTADQIARETLFPNGIFERTLYQLYDVSVRAMAIRLMDLGLVSS